MGDEITNRFITAVRNWLAAKNDPRLIRSVDGETIVELPSCCADFCKWMAEQTDRADRQ